MRFKCIKHLEIQELNFNRAEVGHWREGVEEYANLTLDEVWDRLGLRDKVIPGFATLQDPDGTFDAWTKQGQAVLKGSKATLLTPRWHQLVGLLKLLDNLFLGKPMLLMDEVGIGKTMQAVGLCAMYDYARQYYVEHECFPGQWAKVKYPHTEDGNLPDRPMIISVPTSLVSQWTEEIHRYIAKGSMDLLPHAGTYSHRGDWWASVYAKSKHPPSRQIILTTHSAIASDCDAVFRINDLRARKGRRHGDVQYKATMGDDARKKTLYGHKYGVFIVDEAHVMRTPNAAYCAARELRKISVMSMAMTATPVLTMATDVWHIGCLLGIAKFDNVENDVKLHEYKTKLAAALRADRMHAKSSGADKNIVTRVVRGKEVNKLVESTFSTLVDDIMEDIRKRFDGFVIRRTLHSVDWRKKPISGLTPYKEQVIMLTLAEEEYANLDNIADEAANNSKGGAVVYSNGKSFYLAVRRALLHMACNPEFIWTMPATLQDWQTQSTAKIVAMADLIRYHLESDGRCPLVNSVTNADDEASAGLTPRAKLHLHNRLVPDASDAIAEAGDPVNDSKPDKIVLYMAFPSTFSVLLPILRLYGFAFVTVTGDMPPAKRAAMLKQFARGGRDGARLLILSAVGLVGVNLAIACILIIVDTLWSAQQDQQLIGRLWRDPQAKQVLVYRLIARNTSDVFLNNISFDKSIMHHAFMGSSMSLKRVFDPQLEIDVDDSELQGEIVTDFTEEQIEPPCVSKPSRGRKIANANEEHAEGSSTPETRPKKSRAKRTQQGEPMDKVADKPGPKKLTAAEMAEKKQKEKAEKRAAKEMEQASKRAVKEKEKADKKAAKDQEKAEKKAVKDQQKADKKADKKATKGKQKERPAALEPERSASPAPPPTRTKCIPQKTLSQEVVSSSDDERQGRVLRRNQDLVDDSEDDAALPGAEGDAGRPPSLLGLLARTDVDDLDAVPKQADPSGDAKSTQLPEDIELNDSYPKDILRADSTKVKSTSGQNPFASDRQVPTQYFSARRVPRHGGGTSSELLGSLTPPIRSGLQVLTI
ncbi:predicted protein [Postia placenta Mad-698-R]|nr:predicted protein [Postia placenta Mad-698-R]